MEPRHQRLTGRRTFELGRPLVTALLLATLTARADTPYTATGWVADEPLPGLWCTNAEGQAILRGNAHFVEVESSDPRLTGRRFMYLNGDGQADGSTVLSGTGYQEVGIWNGTEFTPSGGMWQAAFRGVLQADYSLQLSVVGYGVGGIIDGLRIEEAMTRDWGFTPIDPAMPYNHTGTIKPPPVTTTVFSDNFNADVNGWTVFYNAGTASVRGSNQQLVLTGDWRGVAPHFMNNFVLAYPSSLPTAIPAHGQTLECQVDLVSSGETGRNIPEVLLASFTGLYAFHKDRNFVFVNKWTSALNNDVTIFWCTNTAPAQNSNVVLSIALTRDQDNLIITTRVLDKANQNAVLFERSVVDTPQVDPSLTKAQFEALTGITTISLSPDPGPPFPSGLAGAVGMFQFTDGSQPPVTAIWDNIVVRMYDVPPIGMARSVQLTWPAPAGVNYCVEAAPTVQGPWGPVQDSETPCMQHLNILPSRATEFFRLRRVP